MAPRSGAEAPFCYYPCPCGWYGDPVKECTCRNSIVSRYQPNPLVVRRISGLLLDRHWMASARCASMLMSSDL